jgi:hypothetical protein
MKRTLALIPAVVLSLLVSVAEDSPFVRTWKLNVATSRFSGTQAPQGETRTVVAEGDGLKTTHDGTAADGSPISFSYTSSLDGKDSPISGKTPYGADAIAIKRVDANTHTAILKKAGKTLYTTRSVVSKDGKTTTLTGR